MRLWCSVGMAELQEDTGLKWGGKCTHSPQRPGVVRCLQNAERPCRVLVSHRAVPRATGPGRSEGPEPDSLEPACQQGHRPQRKEGTPKSTPGAGNSSPRRVMTENTLRMYGHGNKSQDCFFQTSSPDGDQIASMVRIKPVQPFLLCDDYVPASGM